MPTSTKESRIVKEVNENLGITSTSSDSIINLTAPTQKGGSSVNALHDSKPESGMTRTPVKMDTKTEQTGGDKDKKLRKVKSGSDISRSIKKPSKLITVYDDMDYREVLLNYDPTKNKTRPIMTQDEIALILGKRATMIQYRAKPNIKVKPGMNEKDIAREELRQKKVPFLIQRPIGDGYEIWKIKDLKIKEL